MLRTAGWIALVVGAAVVLGPARSGVAQDDGLPAEDTVPEAPASVDCTARRGGDLVVPQCDWACTETVWRWGLWATQYNVAGTLTFGRHQGIGMFGARYTYDPRFGYDHGIAQPWKNQQDEFAGKIRDPQSKAIDRAALCEYENLHERFVFNHGRTLARRADRIKELASIVVGPVDGGGWHDPRSQTGKRVAAVTECVAGVTDGYCDSVCGNCSYVVPEAGMGDLDDRNAIAEQPAQFPIPEGSPKRRATYYVGGRDQTVRWGRQTWRDPFTHCTIPGARHPTQGSTSRAGWMGGNIRVITGRYGHNSNTDAEAEYTQFSACRDAGLIGRAPVAADTACFICGTRRDSVRGEPSQWPCVDRTNTAQRNWTRNARGPSTSDGDLGQDPAPAPPTCRTSRKPVWGM